ncbi:MAG: hypothetical protein ISS90_00435 [Candidatus Omnitrophica bacterium]|nr:hypothetical protein [Candidatus Omnitrophota bacterium]
MKKLVTVIDLGSNKIAAVSASVRKDGRVNILSLENLYSRGISGGEITDMDKAVEDINSVVCKLQRHRQKRIKNVFVTTKSADVRMDIARGMAPLSKIPREITKRDVKRCLEIAAMVKVPLDRIVIDKAVRGFYIDGGASSIRNPVGLYGIKMEVEAFIATASQSKLQSITKCIDHAGLLLDGIHLSGIASANGVLTGQEKENGVLLLDIGDSLTEELIFKNSMLKSAHIIKKGASAILDDKMRVNKEKLTALLKEVFAGLAAGKNNFSSAVVTGGGALLEGAIEETEKLLGVPARIGIARNAGHNLNSQEAIIHTSTIGLINQIATEYKTSGRYKNPIRKAFRKIHDIYESYF